MVALRILYVKSIYMITHTCRSAQMKIGACFFATIPLEDRQTVTTDGHVHHCLPNFGASAAKKRDSAAVFLYIIFYAQNASVHTAATMVDFLTESEVQLLPHSHSPDVSLCLCAISSCSQK